jgi:hypothetical protein
MGWTCRYTGKHKTDTTFLLENLKGTDHEDDLGRIVRMLKCTLKEKVSNYVDWTRSCSSGKVCLLNQMGISQLFIKNSAPRNKLGI